VPDYTVLIVDDDPVIRESLVELLKGERYRVLAASNGREALDQLERESVALVILDMRMPVLDGLSFAQAATTKRNEGLKVLVITAAVDASQAGRAIHADGYLAKPFDVSALLDEVERLCA
jgi:CheY-like chemotaxis protein